MTDQTKPGFAEIPMEVQISAITENTISIEQMIDLVGKFNGVFNYDLDEQRGEFSIRIDVTGAKEAEVASKKAMEWLKSLNFEDLRVTKVSTMTRTVRISIDRGNTTTWGD